MAPVRPRKQDTSDQGIPDFPPPPSHAISRTPQRSPAKTMAGITQRQKQALIDHLQSEVTERARRLRAQYAEHAQELRARVERRVNRIPQAMKKRTMQELVEEHIVKSKPAPPPIVPVLSKPPPASTTTLPPPVVKEPSKRKSDEISTGDDKENMPSYESHDLENPKKRNKTTVAVANSKATRTASRKAGPAGVLSPKSHNSRTYPQSPFKSASLAPEKAKTSRPASSATTKPATRAPSRQTKRAAPQAEADGRASGASNSSAGTTIITKPGTRKAAVPKKTAASKPVAATRKPAAAAKQNPPATRAGRTLRSRN